jgi:hypothetical protein
MNLTARMQVVMEEITLDVREFLQTMVGSYNEEITRDVVTTMIGSYLTTLEALQVSQVICDESNNPQEVIDAGMLNVDILFMVDYSSFQGKFNIATDATITQEFFMLIKTVKPIHIIQLADPLSIDLPVTEDEVNVYSYGESDLDAALIDHIALQGMKEIPSALASSLKV